MDVDTENAHNKSPVYSGTEALLKPSTGRGYLQGQETYSFEEAYVEFPSRWDLNATTVGSEKAYNCRTNAHYTMLKTNAKYQMTNKCQTDDPLAECQMKYTEQVVKHKNANEEITSKGNPTLTEQFVNTFIEEKHEYQNKISVHMSSSCQYRKADKNTNVRKSRASIVSYPHFRIKRQREPSRISYRMVTRLFNRKQTRKSVKLYIRKCVPKSSRLKAMLCGYHRYYFLERCTRSNFTLYSSKCFIRQRLFIVRTRTPKHKKSTLFCVYAEDYIFSKLSQLRMKSYNLSRRVISLSGDVESNPGPTNQYYNPVSFMSPTNSICLLESRLSQLGRTALDVGGSGDCFFRAVSHQLYGNPNNHFYVRSVGIQYLMQHPEQFIESNTEHSWQGYLERMSRQGTWADAIIIQAVANCMNLSIHIAESNPTFSPVTVVEPMNAAHSLNIYIGHLDEIHYVSTVENRTLQLTNNSTCAQNADENNLIDNSDKACKKDYMREYMKERRDDENFRKNVKIQMM
ncbi:uncharacterized protein LOC144658622 isoform X1 [Oculina patagonica]